LNRWRNCRAAVLCAALAHDRVLMTVMHAATGLSRCCEANASEPTSCLPSRPKSLR
jgi:hypothetical protein